MHLIRPIHFRYLVFAIALLLPALSLAQLSDMQKKRGAVVARKNKLVVLLEKENKFHIARLKGKGQESEIEPYKKRVALYNASIKEAVNSLWSFSEEVEFVEPTQYKEYAKANSRGLVLLTLTNAEYLEGPATDDIMSEARYGKNFTTNGGLIPRLHLYVAGCKEMFLEGVMAEGDCSSGGLGLALLDIQSWLRFWSKGEHLNLWSNRSRGNGKEIKDYTLVVHKDHLDEELANADLSAVYPFQIKVVEDEEFDELILKKVPKHAILFPWRLTVTSSQGSGMDAPTIMFAHSIVALDENKFLEIALPKVALMGKSGSYTTVKKKHLKAYGKKGK